MVPYPVAKGTEEPQKEKRNGMKEPYAENQGSSSR
jgi:hypothetical protein